MTGKNRIMIYGPKDEPGHPRPFGAIGRARSPASVFLLKSGAVGPDFRERCFANAGNLLDRAFGHE
jgi:hypothetical protein